MASARFFILLLLPALSVCARFKHKSASIAKEHAFELASKAGFQVHARGGMNYVMIGNPGVGKSTILNGLTGTSSFEAGVAFFGGLTKELGKFTHDGDTYLDTPGLADMELRKEAAAAINQAMKQGGKFKLFFVVTLEAGRFKPDDITTMKLVTESCDDIPEENGFGVIVNKIHPEELQQLHEQKAGRQIMTKMNAHLNKKTLRVHYNVFDTKLAGKKNVQWEVNEDLKMFVESLAPITIDASHVKEINTDSMDEVMENMASQMRVLEEDKAALERKMDEDRQQMKSMMEKMNEENKKKIEELETKQETAAADVERLQREKRMLEEQRAQMQAGGLESLVSGVIRLALR